METESEQNSSSASGSSSSGGSTRPQISQMSLYERQAVQATIAASRQASSPNTSTPQQTITTQASINLATTSAAQLISRSQSVSSPSATTLTQSVLLGNTTSPPLNQSQAQMYLRPQLGNLLQVNRTLGRNVPLASQLILMPNGAVAAVQQEVPPTQSPGVHADTDQVQNLAVRSQQTSAASAQLQGSAQKAALPGSSQASGLPQTTSTGQTLAVAQTSSGSAGQSLNLSQGAASSNGVSGGVVASGGSQTSTGLSQNSSASAAGSCQRKGTGVVQPLPVAAAQAVTVSQGSQTETENAATKKGETDSGGQQTVGMNLTRTATPAPSQTLISSATYTQIQPHSLIQQQQQIHLQKQVVIQQQIAIHHQQQFQHRQSQLLHTATHLQLAQQQQQQQAPSLTQQQQQAQPPQQQAPPQNQQQAQTLVVQPMLQSQPQPVQLQQDSPCQPATKSPVPIQSKSLVTPIKPPQLGPAKMSATQQPPPHIPVQVVGTRQQGAGQAQALGLAQIAAAVPTSRGMPAVVQPVSQAHAASPSSSSSSSAPASSQEATPLTTGVNLAQVQGTAHMVKSPASSPVVAQMPAAFYMQSVQLPGKSQTLAVKRKAESEEEKEESPSVTALLPARSSPVTDSPKNMEEKSGLGDKSDPAAIATPNTTSSEGASVTPTSAPTPNLAMVLRQMGDSKPPQAIVKPQILTHIIEGFVIQEGAEPFPVGCSQLLKESEKPLQGEAPSGQSENLSSNSPGGDSASMEPDKKANLLKCEYCGKYAPATQFRGSKRFCSMTCAKRYNVSCSHQFRLQRKKMKEFQEANYARVRRRGPRRSSSEIARTKIQGKRHRGQEDSSRGSDNSSYDEALSPTSPGPLSVRASHGERDLANSSMAPPTPDLHGINPVFLSSNPSRWSVEEVYEFIASLQGCQEIAEEFRSQEIDGQALLLLKEEHLMSAMNIKLGPALKICAKINVLKET
ncbi:polyhomeotic-like protein 1 isoform 4-T4 [Cariama cristata]